jgi:hypothetical protein
MVRRSFFRRHWIIIVAALIGTEVGPRVVGLPGGLLGPWWVDGPPCDDVRRVGRVLHLYGGDLVALDEDSQVSLSGRV